MFERALRCERHTEPDVSAIRWWQGALSFRRNVKGTWADDCRRCLWCCLKTWPIPLTMIFDGGLDEYYWGHHRVLKRRQHYLCPCFIFFLFHHVEQMFYHFLIAIFKNLSVKSVHKKLCFKYFSGHMDVSVIVSWFFDVSTHNALGSM